MTYPTTEAGRLAALTEAGGDAARLWYSPSGIVVIDAETVPAQPEPQIPGQGPVSLNSLIKGWARAEAFTLLSGSSIVWPDGASGSIAIYRDANDNVTGFAATYISGSTTKTVTQPDITYENGSPVSIPDLTIT